MFMKIGLIIVTVSTLILISLVTHPILLFLGQCFFVATIILIEKKKWKFDQGIEIILPLIMSGGILTISSVG